MGKSQQLLIVRHIFVAIVMAILAGCGSQSSVGYIADDGNFEAKLPSPVQTQADFAILKQRLREQAFMVSQEFANCANNAGWDFVGGPDAAALHDTDVPIRATVPGSISIADLTGMMQRCHGGDGFPQMVIAIDGPAPVWLEEFQRLRAITGYRVMLTWANS